LHSKVAKLSAPGNKGSAIYSFADTGLGGGVRPGWGVTVNDF